MAPLVSLDRVSQAYGTRVVLDGVSLGIDAGARVGVVGRNGGGKTTLLRIMAGDILPDAGRVSRASDVTVGMLAQAPRSRGTVRELVLGDRPEHEWASRRHVRDTLDELLGGSTPAILGARLEDMSGGERRRAELAALLVNEPDLLVLDEPTNHLDLAAVEWLASHLRSRSAMAVLVVTHDRWFLDEVCLRTWEVAQGGVHQYDGGYSAYVLARAERERAAAAADGRRRNLLRKELAWLRRGPPARTSKPKFRLDAAANLIADEPPPRDSTGLLSFASSRLGKTVVELEGVSVARGGRPVLDSATWRLGPGDRVALLGANGSGKSTTAALLTGTLVPDAGRIRRGKTVRAGLLAQKYEEVDGDVRVIDAVTEIGHYVLLADGRELSASSVCDALGFDGGRQQVRVADLSGGERRRLQLTRLLMTEPNLLVLDEPTNDLDVETLASLEDLLDGFGGTLVVASHDRYFVERVCDEFVWLPGDGRITDLPGGIPEYLERQAAIASGADSPAPDEARGGGTMSTAAQARELRKSVRRAETRLARIAEREARMHGDLANNATDPELTRDLARQLSLLEAEREAVEEEWLLAAEELETLG